jgi:oligoribonuclease (3'-5' exoribonuclease)
MLPILCKTRDSQVLEPYYLLVDLETDGLDPFKCTVLEFGGIILTEQLQEIARFQQVIRHTDIGEHVPAIVVNMHTDNDLWAECRETTRTLFTVDVEIARWVQNYFGTTKPVLAGASVEAVDRPFIKAHMPHLQSVLSHRSLDISSFCREITKLGVPGVPESYNSVTPHRSMPDCEAELQQWRDARAAVRSVVDKAKLHDAHEAMVKSCYMPTKLDLDSF